MTEDQYQATRKVMQKASYIRGLITNAKAFVAKWAALEDSFRGDLKQAQAEGANKNLQKALKHLDEQRQKFNDLKLPFEDCQYVTKWVCAVDNDSFNYFPKEIKEAQFKQAKDEGLELYDTKQAAQSACDQVNSG